MKSTNKRHIQLRYAFVITFMMVLSCAIVWDMFKTSIIYAGAWNAKADSILERIEPIQPRRGRILADNGTVLAANLQFYVARIDTRVKGFKMDSLKAHLGALSDSLAVMEPSRSAEQWRAELLRIYTEKPSSGYRLIKRLLSHSEYERLRHFPFFKLGRGLTGLLPDKDNRRSKPYGDMASRSIGIVARDSSSSAQHGRAGLEMALDSLLYGVPGEQKQIQLTNKFVSAPITPAINGYDITTTINVALQDIVETELYNMCHETDARWGCAILMEVATGEIKAISNLQWNEHQQDYVEGVNHAVLGYEPGSVMKPITMMMALEDGNELVQNIDSPIATGTSFSYGGRVVTDPHGGAFLTPREIIATSSNVGMSKIVLKKYESNPGRFRDRLAEMGFFDPFHSGIGGERQPIVARLGNKVWDKVALTRMAFGYSTEIPPLYTLAMYNAIANDGRFVRPRLVKKLSRAGEPDSIIPVTYIREHVCSPENAAKLRIMLHDVVWSNRGTAHRYLQDPHVDIAGKTGTAYTIENGQYTSQRRLAFCGFFPYDKPRYSCIVLMKGANRGAAASSGMVLKNVALKMYAKGMLGDAPSYASGEQVAPEKGRTAVVYASMNSNLTTNLRRGLHQSKIKAYQRPQQGEGVPNVRGMGVREAIARLEQAGMAVKFSGAGYVVAQTPAAGSKYAVGQTVALKLQN